MARAGGKGGEKINMCRGGRACQWKQAERFPKLVEHGLSRVKEACACSNARRK
jgi:hypothetical protein